MFQDYIIEDYKTLPEKEVDYIIIGVLTCCEECKRTLLQLGIPEQKIIDKYVELPRLARIETLKNISQLCTQNEIKGSVAELGVYRGEFAAYINEYFKDRKLYLFDTFEGLHLLDNIIDVEKGYTNAKEGHFSDTSIDLVLSRMPYKERCHIIQGRFPDSIPEGFDETFCFVNLDADLYIPTLEGLRYFYPRMTHGGIILIHDFFSTAFRGVHDAVCKFTEEKKIGYVPIGDTLSVAIVKEEML